MTDQIRPATADDYPAFAVLFRELGVDDPTPDARRFAADLAPRTLILIEHDDALSGALIAAGAEVNLCLLHYAGPLPPAALERD